MNHLREGFPLRCDVGEKPVGERRFAAVPLSLTRGPSDTSEVSRLFGLHGEVRLRLRLHHDTSESTTHPALRSMGIERGLPLDAAMSLRAMASAFSSEAQLQSRWPASWAMVRFI